MRTLLAQHMILERAAGLNEPSGLTLNADGTALYTFSDDTKAVFKLELKGRLSVSEFFLLEWMISRALQLVQMSGVCYLFKRKPMQSLGRSRQSS